MLRSPAHTRGHLVLGMALGDVAVGGERLDLHFSPHMAVSPWVSVSLSGHLCKMGPNALPRVLCTAVRCEVRARWEGRGGHFACSVSMCTELHKTPLLLYVTSPSVGAWGSHVHRPPQGGGHLPGCLRAAWTWGP